MSELTYGRYLRIDDLLGLQECRSDPPEHDEMLFIVIHQVYELWFKQVLHELDRFAHHVDADEPFRGLHQLKRVLKILKTLVAQLDVLETMTPLEFVSFRSFLEGASGFQSVQFRELEFRIGIKDPGHLERLLPVASDPAGLRRRFEEPSLWDVWLRYLARQGHPVPTGVLERDVTERTTENEAVQQMLIAVYRRHPPLAELCEALTDFDEGVMEWRYRHVMMVERTIGAKLGTGGSLGAEYLRTTLFQPAFPDLWAIRTEF
ncbi:MAG: tryptophan 2,3-dioxygenase [Acidimicrobiales bacterium]